MIPSFLFCRSNADRLAKIHPSALAFRESRFLVLPHMRIVLRKSIPLPSLSAKAGLWFCFKCGSSCKNPSPNSRFPRKQALSFASDVDHLAKIHPSALAFRESRPLVLFQTRIVLQKSIPPLSPSASVDVMGRVKYRSSCKNSGPAGSAPPGTADTAPPRGPAPAGSPPPA